MTLHISVYIKARSSIVTIPTPDMSETTEGPSPSIIEISESKHQSAATAIIATSGSNNMNTTTSNTGLKFPHTTAWLPADGDESCNYSTPNSMAVTVGAILGVLLLVAFIAIAAWLWIRRKSQKSKRWPARVSLDSDINNMKKKKDWLCLFSILPFRRNKKKSRLEDNIIATRGTRYSKGYGTAQERPEVLRRVVVDMPGIRISEPKEFRHVQNGGETTVNVFDIGAKTKHTGNTIRPVNLTPANLPPAGNVGSGGSFLDRHESVRSTKIQRVAGPHNPSIKTTRRESFRSTASSDDGSSTIRPVDRRPTSINSQANSNCRRSSLTLVASPTETIDDRSDAPSKHQKFEKACFRPRIPPPPPPVLICNSNPPASQEADLHTLPSSHTSWRPRSHHSLPQPEESTQPYELPASPLTVRRVSFPLNSPLPIPPPPPSPSHPERAKRRSSDFAVKLARAIVLRGATRYESGSPVRLSSAEPAQLQENVPEVIVTMPGSWKEEYEDQDGGAKGYREEYVFQQSPSVRTFSMVSTSSRGGLVSAKSSREVMKES